MPEGFAEAKIEEKEAISNERLEAVWEKAYQQDSNRENKEKGDQFRAILDKLGKEKAFEVLRSAFARMLEFEAAADADYENHLKISPEVAEKIGSIWFFSGVGSYDKPVKEPRIIDGKEYKGDNPALKEKKFMAGSNRRRMSHAVWLARRIAETRSGKTFEPVPLEKWMEQREKIKELIAEYGPDIVCGGLDIENIEVKELLEQDITVMPAEKVKIIKPDNPNEEWKTTTDQVKNFQSPENVRSKQVALISDDIHLNRILHIFKQFPEHLPKGMPVNLFPSRTPKEGREEFARMELQGLLAYIFRDHVAAEEPYPHIIER